MTNNTGAHPAAAPLPARLAELHGQLAAALRDAPPAAVASLLSDAEVVELAELAASGKQLFDQVLLAMTGVIGARSARSSGHAGLAQSRGHRTPVALVQRLAGVGAAEARRQLRVGEAMLEAGAGFGEGADAPAPVSGGGTVPLGLVWHAPLATALGRGAITSAQHDAIAQGLGVPPEGADEAWQLAAEQLVDFAGEVTVEQLGAHARSLRDLLDPEGANARYLARYEQRSFRMWTDGQGLTHGRFVFDDESAEWVRSIIDAALRPRRGGPRFVSESERADAERLRRDSRTNEQLAHDLLLDVLKAGSVADAASVFGARQAGVRVVTVVPREEFLAGRRNDGSWVAATGEPVQAAERRASGAVARFQESGVTVPGGIAEKTRCNSGISPVVVDEGGNPLDVGRESRLYTSRQRVALALRDGGCRWPGCDRPPSYCEAHHIDHWNAEGGRTDIDRGALLCAFHHLQLHNNGWKITREGLGPFLLHPPPGRVGEQPPGGVKEQLLAGAPEQLPGRVGGQVPGRVGGQVPGVAIEMRAPLPLSYAWQQAHPPPKQFRRAA